MTSITTADDLPSLTDDRSSDQASPVIEVLPSDLDRRLQAATAEPRYILAVLRKSSTAY